MANLWRVAPSTVSQPKLAWFFKALNAGEARQGVTSEFFDAASAPPATYDASVVINYYYKMMQR